MCCHLRAKIFWLHAMCRWCVHIRIKVKSPLLSSCNMHAPFTFIHKRSHQMLLRNSLQGNMRRSGMLIRICHLQSVVKLTNYVLYLHWLYKSYHLYIGKPFSAFIPFITHHCITLFFASEKHNLFDFRETYTNCIMTRVWPCSFHMRSGLWPHHQQSSILDFCEMLMSRLFCINNPRIAIWWAIKSG